MATYTIIGGDKKEYGPVSAEDVGQWIGEGRLNEESLVKTEGDAEFRRLADIPEFAGAFAAKIPPSPAPSAAPPPFASSTGWEGRDYELDIGGCISRGWTLFKDNMGTFFGAFILSMLLVIVGSSIIGAILGILVPKIFLTSPVLKQIFNVVVQVVVSLIVGPLFGGIYYIFIQRMRGCPTSVGDVFIGFQKMFSQLFLGNFAVSFFIGLCLIPFKLAEAAKLEPITDQMRNASPIDIQNIMPQFWPALFGTLPILIICMIPVTYLTVNWQFVGPLIIDKQMKFWPAMKASWKKVHQHWWLLLGFVVVIGLLNIAGVCACCVGALFTAPISIAATMFAYETIFGESQTH
jgi:hypothetical protein